MQLEFSLHGDFRSKARFVYAIAYSAEHTRWQVPEMGISVKWFCAYFFQIMQLWLLLLQWLSQEFLLEFVQCIAATKLQCPRNVLQQLPAHLW